MKFSLSRFFDLSHFTYASLFLEQEFIWNIFSQLNSFLHTLPLGKHEGQISSHAYLIKPELISIGKGSVVEAGAYIEGPCVIGKNCTVRHGAYIRGEVLTGDHCIIGHDTEVKTAIFLDHAYAAHFAYVGNTILGNYVNLGAGTKCANFRLDKKNISLHYQQQKINTNQRKLGAFIGDYTQIGCNTVINPGTLIESHVECYPCLNIGGHISAFSIVKPASSLLVTVKKNEDTKSLFFNHKSL